MAKRIGPTVWSRLWTNFTNAVTREPQKTFVGADSFGNRYYEYKGTRTARSNIRRGFEPNAGAPKPALEWEAWLKGTRRFPPSDEEIALNRQRQQTQLAEDAVTEKRAPKIGSTGKGAADIDRPKSYPKYDDLEINPGMPGLNKVLEGILQFRRTVRADLVKQFERIRDNPNPTAVFFTCMDSRMLPARFTHSQVGDMFVVRNSGNMIPHAANYGISGYEVSVTTEPAALELAVKRGHINHVIVCGHSDCKAINTLYNIHKCSKNFDPESPMDHWLRRHGYSSIKKLEQRLKSDPNVKLEFAADNPLLLNFTAVIDPENKFNVEDKLSQINTLQQLTHVASHGFLLEFLENRKVFLHAMWFDIYTGNMYMFSKEQGHFTLVDEGSVPSLVAEVDKEMHSEIY